MLETCALVLVWIGIIRLTRMVFLPLFIVLTLPGTLLHELLHFIVGLLLGARPVVISILPRRMPDGWQLGRVGFANLNAVNSIPVCLAPLALAPLAYWAGVKWVAPLAMTQWVLWSALSYLLASGVYAAWPSRADWSLAFRALFVLSLFAAALAALFYYVLLPHGLLAFVA